MVESLIWIILAAFIVILLCFMGVVLVILVMKRRERANSINESVGVIYGTEPGSDIAVELTQPNPQMTVTPNMLPTPYSNTAPSAHSMASAESGHDIDIAPVPYSIGKMKTQDSLYLDHGQEGAQNTETGNETAATRGSIVRPTAGGTKQ